MLPSMDSTQGDRLFSANRFEIADDRTIESPGGSVEEETRPRVRKIESDRIGKIICESIVPFSLSTNHLKGSTLPCCERPRQGPA